MIIKRENAFDYSARSKLTCKERCEFSDITSPMRQGKVALLYLFGLKNLFFVRCETKKKDYKTVKRKNRISARETSGEVNFLKLTIL